MKKMIWAFFVSVFCIPTFATECVRIEPDVIFDTFFDDQDTQINVLNTYLHEIENGPCKNVAAVDAKGLWNLCKAAKINIKTPEGKTDCSNKLYLILRYLLLSKDWIESTISSTKDREISEILEIIRFLNKFL